MNQLIPPPGSEAALSDSLTMSDRAAVWFDLMETADELLFAGLRHEVGPDGDVQAAYRHWYTQQMNEHDRVTRRAAENLFRRGVRHGH
jgi:hypothetical protein